MRETRLSGSEGGGTKPIVSSYPYIGRRSRNHAALNDFSCRAGSMAQDQGMQLRFVLTKFEPPNDSMKVIGVNTQ